MMDLKNLFTDEDAVSPVIGVILMVAITVILAAVIGAFVLNIGGNQEAAPQAQVDFSYSGSSLDNITHGGGGAIDMSQMSIDYSASGSISGGPTLKSSGTVSAGEGLLTGGDNPNTGTGWSSGDTITITWTSSSGENSQIFAESQVP